jgi:hypothetical protein
VKLRRIVAVAVAVGAAASMPGAQPVAAGDVAATVNGVDISVDAFENTLTQLGAGDVVPGDGGRGVLRELVINEAMRQFLTDHGVDPDTATVAGGTTADYEQLRAQYELMLAEADVSAPDSVRDEYEGSGIAAGLVCLRLFGVSDVEAAEEAMDAIADGEDFDDVGADNDPGFEARRGTVSGDPDQPCIEAASLSEAVQPIFEALDEAGAGEPTGPVETQFGLVVVMAPPYDEVSGILAGRAAFTEFLSTIDVTVNPRYGRWDAATASIVPLGQE